MSALHEELLLPPDSQVPLIELRYSEPANRRFEARALMRDYLEAASEYAADAGQDDLELAEAVNAAWRSDLLVPADDAKDDKEHGAKLAKLVREIYVAWRDPNPDKLHDVLDIAHKCDRDAARALRHFEPERERGA